MTSHYETRTITKEKSQIVKIVCDWCGEEIPLKKDYSFIREFELSFAEGRRFPGTAMAHGWHVEDLCDECVEKLHALLIDADVKVSPYEFSY